VAAPLYAKRSRILRLFFVDVFLFLLFFVSFLLLLGFL
jgi:hypothetical protein